MVEDLYCSEKKLIFYQIRQVSNCDVIVTLLNNCIALKIHFISQNSHNILQWSETKSNNVGTKCETVRQHVGLPFNRRMQQVEQRSR